MSLETGDLLNKRYRILDVLGQGGMGAVYRALDENLDLFVAVKENTFLSEDYSRQFKREAKVLATLRHPNLPRVFDHFVIDQQGQYLVMDYIEGEDLREWMTREETLSEVEALQIGIQICDALIFLHEQMPAITHRDIKPGNIKITPEGSVVLVDFGLVKILLDQEMTTTAARAMTPGYSPPEQYGDAPTDQRSDIFSLGATLYAAMVGFLPEDSLARTTGKADLTPLRSYNPQVSSRTAKAIEKALALRYEARWQTAREFKQNLLQALEALPQGQQSQSRFIGLDKNEINHNAKLPEDLREERPAKQLYTHLRRLDPVWIIFGATVLLLLILLGVSLAWPAGVERLIGGGDTANPPLALGQSPTLDQTLDLSQRPLNEAAQDGESSPPSGDSAQSLGLTPSPTPIGGGAGMLAFVSERTGQPQIWLLDLFSRNVSQLSDVSEGACQPDWSPDGMRIVFTTPCTSKRSRYPASSLVIIDITTQVLTPLAASLEGDFNPAWSPDGEQLAFVRIRGVKQIWLMGADGEDPVQFARSGLIDNSNPAWYPDKSVILYSQALGLGSPSKQLFGMRLADLGESEEYPISPSSRLDYIPLMDNVDVSKDGFWLAFDYWYFDVLSDVYIMPYPGGSLVQMTQHPGMDYDPVWRPLP